MATQLDRPPRVALNAPAHAAADAQPAASHRARRSAAATSAVRREPNLALASLQLVLGYEWLASGVDKQLYGRFPQTLGALLAGTLRGGAIPALFASVLRAVVLPHSAVFGALVEWGETLAGLGLIAAGVAALLAPGLARRLGPWAAGWVARGHQIVDGLAVGAAAGAGIMGLSFYVLDGMPAPWFMPSIAYNGALDAGLLLALGSAILLVSALGEWRGRRGRISL
jgi:hypothetical protein